MLVVIHAKILHHNFITTAYKMFKLVLLLILSKQKFGNLHNWLMCAIE